MAARFFLPAIALVAAAELAAQGTPARPAEPPPQVPTDVVAGLDLAKTVVRRSGDRIWAGYGKAPFGFLFVAPDHEILVCDERLPDGFVRLTPDRKLGCAQALGPKSWRQPNLLAAMPVFGRPSVIVMGSPAATDRTAADWTATIFHEHFHQWQAELPDYYTRVADLGLAGDDRTGMWMLTYPFPYDDPKVGAAFAVAAKALGAAVAADPKTFAEQRQAFLSARAAFAETVSAKDWRYLEFQLWQEGVARWSEIAVAARSGRPFLRAAAKERRASTLGDLAVSNLAEQKRIAFYAFGAAEAMLLDRSDPNWRTCYAAELSLGPLHGKQCRKQPLSPVRP